MHINPYAKVGGALWSLNSETWEKRRSRRRRIFANTFQRHKPSIKKLKWSLLCQELWERTDAYREAATPTTSAALRRGPSKQSELHISEKANGY